MIPGTQGGRNCEISLQLLPDSAEAFLYRSKTPQGEEEHRECVDAVADIVDGCIKNGPNSGRLVGESGDQIYEAGFRQHVSSSEHGHVENPLNEDAEAAQKSSVAAQPPEKRDLHGEDTVILYASRYAPTVCG